MADMLLYLTSVALVGAAIIILFGIASFSFLYPEKEMLKGSGLHSQGLAVEPTSADVFPTPGDAAPAPPEAKLPNSAAVQSLSASPTQDEATGDARPPKISGLQPASEPLSLSGEASVAKIGLTKWNSAAIPTSAERRDQMFQEFENYHAKARRK
jgi:hypothetical protein